MHWDKTLRWIRHIFKSLTASLLVAMVFVSCGGTEPDVPTPGPGPGPDPKPPVETKDTKAPTITVKIAEKNVIAWVVVSVKDNQLLFDQDVAATWTDDISKSCKVDLSLVPSGGQSKAINSGDVLSEEGKLQVKVSDEAGNSSEAEITLTAVMTYHAPNLTTADVIDERYPWYRVFNPRLNGTKNEFIYPHILVSYVALAWYKVENLEYIIATEVPEETPCEDVGSDQDEWYRILHADQWYRHIRKMSPESTIKASSGGWNSLMPYIDQHPDRVFMISCAGFDPIGADFKEDLLNHEEYPPLVSLLAHPNVILSFCVGNAGRTAIKTLNEEEAEQELWGYCSASVNSLINNKYTVVGYDPNRDIHFGKNINDESRRPVGFDEATRNTVVPFIPLLSINDRSVLSGCTSSFPTATFSGTLGNFLSILMSAHPGTTLEGASTIMREKYFRGETFQYIDQDDGSIKDGERWYFIDTDKFIHEEILHETEVKAALLTTPQSLPSAGGLYYEGKGIQFTVDGQTYDMTDENRSILENAVQSGKEITWSYNSDRARKYGVSESDSITVKVMDRQARLVPDVSFSILIN